MNQGSRADLFAAIQSALDRIRSKANLTPIATSRTLDELTGAHVFLKCENFQRGGAFKFRGAFNAMSLLTEDERRRGVIAYSSGNHAQAVALVGKLLGISTTVVMPDNAPVTKRAATESYGASVVSYDPEQDTREAIAARLAEQHGYVTIPPFDHEHIVAGQGTATLELLQEVGDLDWLLVPCGGGGLLSGSAVAAKHSCPSINVIGIEPEVADDATQSFRSKTLKTVRNPQTIADGTRTTSLGKVTFPLVLEYVHDMRTVSESAIIDAVKFLFYRMKLVVEPSGSLGVAALLGGAVQVSGRVGVILSGGNIDGPTMRAILQEHD